MVNGSEIFDAVCSKIILGAPTGARSKRKCVYLSATMAHTEPALLTSTKTKYFLQYKFPMLRENQLKRFLWACNRPRDLRGSFLSPSRRPHSASERRECCLFPYVWAPVSDADFPRRNSDPCWSLAQIFLSNTTFFHSFLEALGYKPAKFQDQTVY